MVSEQVKVSTLIGMHKRYRYITILVMQQGRGTNPDVGYQSGKSGSDDAESDGLLPRRHVSGAGGQLLRKVI